MKLKGRIVNGYGKASEIMSELQEWYEATLGASVAPGTVNVELETDFAMPKERTIVAHSPLSGQKFYYLPVQCFGKPAWIMRPEHHPFENNVIELIAVEHLATTYGVKKGDLIEIAVL